jgi:hypothetical protein
LAQNIFLFNNYRNLFFGYTQSYDFSVNNTVLNKKSTPEVIKFTKKEVTYAQGGMEGFRGGG